MPERVPADRADGAWFGETQRFDQLWIKLALYPIALGVHLRHFPFHRKFRRWPFREIRSAEARTYRPLREYGGWGIRIGPGGLAYNVKGDRGVQLVLTSGLRILIGSQEPEALAAAIAKGRHA